MTDEFPALAKQMADAGIAMGAADVVPFLVSDVVFDERTLLKCMYGCDNWGKGLTCPSRKGAPSMVDFERMLKKYRWGVIVHTHDFKDSHRVSLTLERMAFREGKYLAMSFSDCAMCETCAGVEGENACCRHPRDARPALHAVGVDVFATVQKLGLPLCFFSGSAEPMELNLYSAVFVE